MWIFWETLKRRKSSTMTMGITTILNKVVCISLKTQIVPKKINTLTSLWKWKPIHRLGHYAQHTLEYSQLITNVSFDLCKILLCYLFVMKLIFIIFYSQCIFMWSKLFVLDCNMLNYLCMILHTMWAHKF